MKKEFAITAGFTLDSGIKNEFRGNARSLLRAIARGNGFSQTQKEDNEEIEEEEEEDEEEAEEEAEEAETEEAEKGEEAEEEGEKEEEKNQEEEQQEAEDEEVVNQKQSVYIQNQLSGLVLTIKDDQTSGAQVT